MAKVNPAGEGNPMSGQRRRKPHGEDQPKPIRAICGANKKGGGICQSTALYPNGRCRAHGGASTGRPIVHGRYARVAKGILAARLEAGEQDGQNPLDMMQEIQLAQALLDTLLIGLDAIPSGEQIGALVEVADRINRMQARVIRARNDTALTVAEVAVLREGLKRIFIERFPDPDQRRMVLAELRGLLPRRVGGGD